MTTFSLKRKLVRTRIALAQTVNKILEINRRRKQLSEYVDIPDSHQRLKSELHILNQLADNQVRLIRRYENQLRQHRA